MFYMLDWKAENNAEFSNTDSAPYLGVPWSAGIYYPDPLPEPIICELNPKRGDKLRDVYLVDLPVFSNRLISVLHECGVDNIQLYKAELHNEKGEKFDEYKAANIVGTVACANLELSEYFADTEPPLMDFRKLVIDESKIETMQFFRLAECTATIILSERIKNKIDASGLAGFTLVPLESS